MGYQPIENYGIIGDMRTTALVGMNGSIDWFCVPNFDSPSVFAAILDDKKGGRFQICPVGDDWDSKQYYLPETNILVTRFLSDEGVAEVVDYMPVAGRQEEGAHHVIVRRVTGVRGHLRLKMLCDPAFDYARGDHDADISEYGAIYRSSELTIGMYSSVPLESANGVTRAEFSLQEGGTATFVLGELDEGSRHPLVLLGYGDEDHQNRTASYWRGWLAGCTYTGRWREQVYRSALVLKLLTHADTGAVIAAATTSLPEEFGGVRNWDYRYTWIRDASFTIYGLLRIGLGEAATGFMGWIEDRCRELNPDGSLQLMYGIDGRHDLPEEELDHLEGYVNSKPVRIGNGAYDQLQLDIYGELMDSVYLYNKWVSPISYDFWEHLATLVDFVCDNWDQTDEGIWEVRGGQQHFVYSKVMCWVAINRALRMAEKRGFPHPRGRWMDVQDTIYKEIMDKGWSEERQAFVQAYDSDLLDASNLTMALFFFLSPTDPRMLKTIDAIDRPTSEGGLVSNSLVYRYDPETSTDGLAGEEGSFNICTFWLIEALTRAGKVDRTRLARARLLFEQMLGYSNHLGLYAEQIGPRGQAQGNFPQAFTHIGLISAAYNLDRALGRGV